MQTELFFVYFHALSLLRLQTKCGTIAVKGGLWDPKQKIARFVENHIRKSERITNIVLIFADGMRGMLVTRISPEVQKNQQLRLSVSENYYDLNYGSTNEM